MNTNTKQQLECVLQLMWENKLSFYLKMFNRHLIVTLFHRASSSCMHAVTPHCICTDPKWAVPQPPVITCLPGISSRHQPHLLAALTCWCGVNDVWSCWARSLFYDLIITLVFGGLGGPAGSPLSREIPTVTDFRWRRDEAASLFFFFFLSTL